MATPKNVEAEAPVEAPVKEYPKVYSRQSGYSVQINNDECVQFTPILKPRFRSGAPKMLSLGGYYVPKNDAEMKFFERIVKGDFNLAWEEIPQDED